jgi:glucose/arabinose dehydrogenase
VTARRRRLGRLSSLGTAALVLAAGCSSASNPASTALTINGRAVTSSSGSGPVGSAPPTSGATGAGQTTKINAKVKLTSVATFDNPTAMTARKGTSTLYVAEQPGRIKTVRVGNGAYTIDSAPLLDINQDVGFGGERGLLGLAFSPDGGKLYTYFTDTDGQIHLLQWTMNGDAVDTSSRKELLSLDHARPNHNGGQLQFGPDGFLYIGIGDGGGGGDPDHNGQNPRTLYGKVLRIDPSKAGTDGRNYAIPAGNPFADGTNGAPEVWIYGARNPWRFSFDTSGDLWIGDVGQDAVEEIDRLPAAAGGAGRGANLGWNQMEGSRPYMDGSPPPNSTLPIFEYTHDNGACSVIGGSVYHGTKVPALAGIYLYSDYCVGDVRGLLTQNGTVVDDTSLGANVDHITSFGVDNDSELYAFSQDGGMFTFGAARATPADGSLSR